jgi:hypothetical protein
MDRDDWGLKATGPVADGDDCLVAVGTWTLGLRPDGKGANRLKAVGTTAMGCVGDGEGC